MEAIVVAVLVALTAHLWLRQRRLIRERAEVLERDRRVVEAAERAGAEMEALVYTVSHDLKGPLFALLGYLDLIKLEAGDRLGDTAGYIERMASTADYMQHLINDLLAFSRIGRFEARADDVDLSAVATAVASELQASWPGAHFDVGGLPFVHMSPVRARQLLNDLFENAVRHGGRDDVSVGVAAERDPDGGARLFVSDDGRGVPAEFRERVFGVFERLDERNTGDGTGIGLAACRKIVEQLGGTIRLVDAPAGARIEIVLPAAIVRWHPAPVTVS